tara:strand:- start:1017 stop:1541 length:525 start_codon:yes stop_codon:yes gene_type:complete
MVRNKIKHKFKTRIIDNKRYMICRNSIEDKSHWSWEHFKNKPRCQNYSEVCEETTAVMCWRCSHSTVPGPEIKSGYVSKGRMRGWQFMKEFVDKEGNVFHKGKAQPKLKGTLKPTEPKPPKKKLSKLEKSKLHEAILQQMVMVRGNLKKSKWKKDIRAGYVQLRKLERQLKKVN